jgi:hypothetical protein
LRRVAAELEGPELLQLRLDALVYSIDRGRPEPDLSAVIEAVAGRPLAAQHAAFLFGALLGMREAEWTPAALEPTARELLQGPSLIEGLLSEAIIAAAGSRSGWAPVWRELLIALRNHPEADVRQAALETVTATED